MAISALLHRYLDIDLGPTLAAGVFPDATDKLLCQVLHLTPSGRMYGHTLLGAALSTLLVRSLWGMPAARAWALGYVGHLAADMDGFVPWLYPFREYDFEGEDIGLFAVMRRAIRNPINMIVELALLAWAVCALFVSPGSEVRRCVGTQRTETKRGINDR